MLGHVYGKYDSIISLKALGNYSYQFWSNEMLVLLLERPKPNISMISGFLSPGGPLFMDLNVPKYSEKYKKHYGNMFGKYHFYKSEDHFVLRKCLFYFGLWNFGYLMFIKFCEDGDREMMKIPVNDSSKSWICISYLLKTMKWKFGKFCIFK